MNTADYIIESFNLDPVKVFDETYEMRVLYESNERELKTLTDNTTKGATKENIFQKIWNFIKKVFALITRGIGKIFDFITSIFKKKKQTVDGIADSVGLTPASKHGTDGKTSQNILLPSNPRSEITVPDNIESIAKPILVSFNEDEKSIDITLNDITKRGDVSVTPQLVSTSASSLVLSLITIMENDDLMSEFNSLCELIINANFAKIDIDTRNKWIFTYQEFNNNIINKMPKTSNGEKIRVSLSKLKSFSLAVNKLQKKFEAIDMPTGGAVNNNGVQFLNEFSNILNSIQMSINYITGAMKGIYVIDARYNNSISDITQLSKFIKKCIDSAIPPKYIAYNSYLVSSPDIKGTSKNYKPVWGQSRLVFFPNDDKSSIYKIALSQWGIRSNKAEHNITQAFNANGIDNLVAEIKYSYGNFVITKAKRLNIPEDSSSIPDDAIRNLCKNVEAACMKYLNVKISDIHKDNVGYDNSNHLLVTDYAWLVYTG